METLAKFTAVALVTAFALAVTFFVPYAHLLRSCY